MIRLLERLGVPRVLMLGFLAVAIFMTGDGFELTFLSKFMVDQGFSSSPGFAVGHRVRSVRRGGSDGPPACLP